MKEKDNAVLIEGLRKLSAQLAEMADKLDTGAPETPPAPKPGKLYTKEEARAILADKSRSGYRAEVKAILTAHGAERLSEIDDPEVLTAIATEAEVLGGG